MAAASGVVFSLGSLLGAALTERTAERRAPRAVLVASAIASALAMAGLIASLGPGGCLASLFLVGLTCAPHHPLALARAHEQLPRNPGAVQALAQVSVVLEVVAPLAVGAIADRFGLRAGLACLLAQPAMILACALFASSRRRGVS
jgi:fucose permease